MFSNLSSRSILAISVLIFTIVSLTVLAGVAIDKNQTDSLMIFNIVLPVFASWVGTILAFYFGKENFESANKQVRELVNQVNSENKPKRLISTAMRTFENTEKLVLASGQKDEDIFIEVIKSKFNSHVSRLPILNSDLSPKYLIHSSFIDKWTIEQGKESDTLKTIAAAKLKEISKGHGFIVVSENETIERANELMINNKPCQDIIITKTGQYNEPVIGWISNIRLSRYLGK